MDCRLSGNPPPFLDQRRAHLEGLNLLNHSSLSKRRIYSNYVLPRPRYCSLLAAKNWRPPFIVCWFSLLTLFGDSTDSDSPIAMGTLSSAQSLDLVGILRNGLFDVPYHASR
jgi:hypothetical protein